MHALIGMSLYRKVCLIFLMHCWSCILLLLVSISSMCAHYYLADRRENKLNPTTTIVAIGLGNKDIQGKN